MNIDEIIKPYLDYYEQGEEKLYPMPMWRLKEILTSLAYTIQQEIQSEPRLGDNYTIFHKN